MGRKIKTAKRKKVDSVFNLVRAIAIKIYALFQFVVKRLFFSEFGFLVILLGISYLLVNWGISPGTAGYIAYLLTPLVLIIIWLILSSVARLSLNHWCRVRGHERIKLSTWLIKVLVDRQSPQWSEYQDWLHDIFLARRQMLERNCPAWQVAILTYWRLSAFLTVVSFSKIKSLAISVMRWR